MYVRIWRHDGGVSDRPTNIVWDYPDQPYRYRAAEWRADEFTEHGRGSLIVTAAQVFADNGAALGERIEFDPPYMVVADERGVDRWMFRVRIDA